MMRDAPSDATLHQLTLHEGQNVGERVAHVDQENAFRIGPERSPRRPLSLEDDSWNLSDDGSRCAREKTSCVSP